MPQFKNRKAGLVCPAFLFPITLNLLCAAPCKEVPDDRDDREDQQQVDREACDMQYGEAANPQQDENDSQNEKHFAFFLCCGMIC
jgi:hypothetical protein